MPTVKKLKPINLIVDRNLIISALAVYGLAVQNHKMNNISMLYFGSRNKLESEFFELKTHFFQKFKTDYSDVINNSVALLVEKIEQIDMSQKDVSLLNKIYERYIDLLKESEEQPVRLIDINSFKVNFNNRSQWLYKGFVYEIQGHFSEDEIRLLILEDLDKERRRFEKLRAKFDGATAEDLNYERPRIPEKVRIEVWRRDGGKCARCGSREKLEYDHIVPISKGGSNTVRNIELLCEKCNRSKSNNVV